MVILSSPFLLDDAKADQLFRLYKFGYSVSLWTRTFFWCRLKVTESQAPWKMSKLVFLLFILFFNYLLLGEADPPTFGSRCCILQNYKALRCCAQFGIGHCHKPPFQLWRCTLLCFSNGNLSTLSFPLVGSTKNCAIECKDATGAIQNSCYLP